MIIYKKLKIEITVENTADLVEKYFIGVPTPIEPWKGKHNVN